MAPWTDRHNLSFQNYDFGNPEGFQGLHEYSTMHFELTDFRLGCGGRKPHPDRSTLTPVTGSRQHPNQLNGNPLGLVAAVPGGARRARDAAKRGVLRRVDNLRANLQEYGGGLRGHVRVFANTTAVTDFLPEIFPGFLFANPRMNVDLQEKSNAEIARGVLDCCRRCQFDQVGVRTITWTT